MAIKLIDSELTTLEMENAWHRNCERFQSAWRAAVEAAPAIDDETRKPLTDQEICDIALPFVNSYSDGAYGIHEDRVESFARTIEIAVIGKIRGSDGQ